MYLTIYIQIPRGCMMIDMHLRVMLLFSFHSHFKLKCLTRSNYVVVTCQICKWFSQLGTRQTSCDFLDMIIFYQLIVGTIKVNKKALSQPQEGPRIFWVQKGLTLFIYVFFFLQCFYFIHLKFTKTNILFYGPSCRSWFVKNILLNFLKEYSVEL